MWIGTSIFEDLTFGESLTTSSCINTTCVIFLEILVLWTSV
jgi:hypothetical protein